jgi:hypothetical protein
MLSRRQVVESVAALGLTSFATPSLAQQLYRTDLLEKKRANARNRTESPAAKSKRKDVNVDALLAKVDSARLTDTMKTLTSFPTRWSLSPGLVQARDFLRKQFLDYGYPQSRVSFVDLTLPNGMKAQNVLCAPEKLDEGFVLIGAHYDCISETANTLAPGADDNASGTAAVLEVARVLAGVGLKRGVMFALFAGEEQGLFGSQAVADLAARDNWAIDVMVNLDMVGHVDTHPQRATNIVVEYDQGNKSTKNDAAAKMFGLQMAQLVADYTSMTVEHTDIWASDYMPFEAKGYPCIGLYDGASDEPFYHKTTDTMAQVSIPRLTEVTRLLAAFVATTAELRTS